MCTVIGYTGKKTMHGQRTTVIKARCAPEEKQLLVSIAEVERRDLSETLRELVRDRAKELGLWPPRTPPSERQAA